jgi:phosphoribosylamine--glycine ligase
MKRAMETIIQPTVNEMERRGIPYEGVIFAGLMINEGIPKLIEYNVRFGDPECQALMIRLGPQILDLILACNDKNLATTQVNWANDHSITVVMATQGYPQNYVNGSEIRFISEITNDSLNQVFHAGTKVDKSKLVANGGRVLNITTRGETLMEARNRAYENIKSVDWPKGFYRTDIGWRAL